MDDAKHIIIQWPDKQQERDSMFEGMLRCSYQDLALVGEKPRLFPVLLGKAVGNVTYCTMEHVYNTAGEFMRKTYIRLFRSKTGDG